MNAHQTEAIANADAHLSNAVLPTYSELLVLLDRASYRLSQHAPFSDILADTNKVLIAVGKMTAYKPDPLTAALAASLTK